MIDTFTNDLSSTNQTLNYNDNTVLDAITLDKKQYSIGLMKSIFFTTIAIFVFFVPITLNGKTDITFGIIYNFIKRSLGAFGLWLICGIIISNGLLSIYAKYLCKCKKGRVYDYYKEDSIIHPILYMTGAIFAFTYLFDVSFAWFHGPNWIVGAQTGQTVIPAIVLDVAWIIPVGSFFMPFLLNYGVIDFVGSLMEPLMRPMFKVPGRSAVNAIASFVSSSSVGVLITSKLYKNGVYTQREAAAIATGFSAVSVGFAYMVIKTAALSEYFIQIYLIAMLVTLMVSFFMIRIPPLSRKPAIYFDGRMQNQEDLKTECKFSLGMIKKGFDRGIKKAYLSNKLGTEIKNSLIDGYTVLPKVLSLLTAVGILALVIAEYTPVFQWIGVLFEPLLRLLQIPNAAEISPSLPVGIAEMFLPVLLIADKVDVLSIGARFIVVVVSMVQIIFFSETVVVMMSTKLPINLKELIICFIERTIIAIPIAALFMHLLF